MYINIREYTAERNFKMLLDISEQERGRRHNRTMHKTNNNEIHF